MCMKFSIFQEALPNLLELLSLDFPGARNKTKKPQNFFGDFLYIKLIE